MNVSVASWLESLQAHGYRLTEARRAVIEVVATSKRALSPLEVYEIARRRYPALGLVSVYRTLETLNALRLVQRVHQENGCNAYLPRVEGHQHLLICEQCGQAEYFEGDDLDALFAVVGERTGFEIHSHWLQLFGLCQHCKQTS